MILPISIAWVVLGVALVWIYSRRLRATKPKPQDSGIALTALASPAGVVAEHSRERGGAQDGPLPERRVRMRTIVGSCLRTAEYRPAAIKEESDMGVFNGMFPIQAGKEEDARAFAAETVGARLAGFEAHHARVGNTRETFTLQETPVGSFLFVWFEGDVQNAFVDLATDDSDFTKWFGGRVRDLTRVDLAAPPDGPPPAVLFDWHA